MMVGTGVDLVDVRGFREQLADRASTFAQEAFTAKERRSCRGRASGDEARHLAARYAAKEAVLKAWSGSRFGLPPRLPGVPLRDIEVVTDAYGRPGIALHGEIARELEGMRVSLSLSHDGDYAMAFVVVSANPATTREMNES